MKHRVAVLGAVAIGLMLAMLLVGRARAVEPDPARWVPGAGVTWQYQLSGPIDVELDAQIFDVDLFTTRATVVADLHARGRWVLCYMSAGTWEPYRPDADRFPAAVKGRPVDGWPDERWLDTRRGDVVRPVMRDRLDRCAAKGFDGVEFDWIDSHVHATGFAITRAQQLRYVRWLARAAHARGLAVALKNGPSLVRAVAADWDLAVTEECVQYAECWRYRPFTDRGKPVLDVEYALPRAAFCDRVARRGISGIRKHLDLDAWRATC